VAYGLWYDIWRISDHLPIDSFLSFLFSLDEKLFFTQKARENLALFE